MLAFNTMSSVVSFCSASVTLSEFRRSMSLPVTKSWPFVVEIGAVMVNVPDATLICTPPAVDNAEVKTMLPFEDSRIGKLDAATASTDSASASLTFSS